MSKQIVWYLGLDVGNEESAYCIIDTEYKPVSFGKMTNEDLRNHLIEIKKIAKEGATDIIVASEMVASYGMPVGKSVFETCVWIGIFKELMLPYKTIFVYRSEVKMNLCYNMRAKDSNVRQSLIDRFGLVGTKKEQGWFYGFKSDIWSAYAVAVTFLDKLKIN